MKRQVTLFLMYIILKNKNVHFPKKKNSSFTDPNDCVW